MKYHKRHIYILPLAFKPPAKDYFCATSLYYSKQCNSNYKKNSAALYLSNARSMHYLRAEICLLWLCCQTSVDKSAGSRVILETSDLLWWWNRFLTATSKQPGVQRDVSCLLELSAMLTSFLYFCADQPVRLRYPVIDTKPQMFSLQLIIRLLIILLWT